MTKNLSLTSWLRDSKKKGRQLELKLNPERRTIFIISWFMRKKISSFFFSLHSYFYFLSFFFFLSLPFFFCSLCYSPSSLSVSFHDERTCSITCKKVIKRGRRVREKAGKERERIERKKESRKKRRKIYFYHFCHILVRRKESNLINSSSKSELF